MSKAVRCPATSKVRYRAEQEAQMALTDAKIQRALHHKQKRREERVYYCHSCEGFHLTSREGKPS